MTHTGADPAHLLSASSCVDLLGRLSAGLALDAADDRLPLHAVFSASMLVAGAAAVCLPALSVRRSTV